MKKTFIFIFLFLVGCSPTSFLSSSVATLSTGSQERGFGGYVTDGEITTRLKLVLFRRDYEMYQQVNINVYEGRVLLTGNVPTKKIKDDVVKVTWQIPGVKSVMDETVVAPMRTFTQYIKDKWITTRLETMLLFDQAIKSRNYDVHTQNGVVYVVGLAQSDGELQMILKKAQSIQGVVRVVAYVRTINPLEVKRNDLLKNSWNRTHGNTPEKMMYRENLQAQKSIPVAASVMPTEPTSTPPSESQKLDSLN